MMSGHFCCCEPYIERADDFMLSCAASDCRNGGWVHTFCFKMNRDEIAAALADDDDTWLCPTCVDSHSGGGGGGEGAAAAGGAAAEGAAAGDVAILLGLAEGHEQVERILGEVMKTFFECGSLKHALVLRAFVRRPA